MSNSDRESIERHRYIRAVLSIVRQGEGTFSWYNIERRLSNEDVPRQFDLMAILIELSAVGLVVRNQAHGSEDSTWELTDSGVHYLTGPVDHAPSQ